jgi:hypothetical protein
MLDTSLGENHLTHFVFNNFFFSELHAVNGIMWTNIIHINVTLRHIRATIVAVEKQLSITYSECVCSLNYAGREVHAPYYIIYGLSALPCFPQYLTHGATFGIKVIEH